MARTVKFGVELDHNDLVREGRQAGQILSRNINVATATATRAGAGLSGGTLGGVAGGVLGGLVGYASIQGAQMALRQVQQIDEMGIAYRRAEQSANQLVGSQERLNDLMAKMDEISGGAATEMEKLSTVTQLTALGFANTTEQFERFQRGVAGASMATGFNQGYTQQQLMLAIANQSTMRLDQLGLSIAETEARIEELKASSEGLTEQQIYAEAILGLLNEKYGSLVDVAADNVTELQKLGVALADAQVRVANFMQENVINPSIGEGRYLTGASDYSAVRGYARRFAPIGNERTPQWILGLQDKLEEIMPSGSQANLILGETIEVYEDMVAKTGQRNKDLQDSMAATWEEYRSGEISAAELVTAFRGLRGEIDALIAASYMPMGRTAAWDQAQGPTPIPLAESLWAGGLLGVTGSENDKAALQIRQQAQAEREREREAAEREAEADRRRAESLYDQQVREAEAVRDQWVSAAQDVVSEFKRRLDRVPGLTTTSRVTGDQMAMAEEGIGQNFADNFVRRLEDEMFGSKKDWAGVDASMMYSALGRIGVDTSGMTEKGAFETFRQRWADSSLFASAENLSLIDKTAVEAELRLQEMADKGRENIYAMFGVSEDPEAVANLENAGIDAMTNFVDGMLTEIPELSNTIGYDLAEGVGNAWAEAISEQGMFASFRDALMVDMMSYVAGLVNGDTGGGTAPADVATP